LPKYIHMNKDNIIDKLREIFGKSVQQLNILEEKIDIGLQMEYFEQTKELRKEADSEQILQESDCIFHENTSNDEIKKYLVLLAGLSEVKALRKIEEYKQSAPDELKDWVVLAHHESKMNIESVLLDKNLIYISTGLGGKEGKLRYFIVLSSKNKNAFTTSQESIIEKELRFTLGKHAADLENISFQEFYAAIVALVPLHVAMRPVFKEAIEECNQLGNFLNENYLVTNVKIFNNDEILSLLNKDDSDAPEQEFDIKEI